MKKYTYNQVSKALENKGFRPQRSFGNETEYTYLFTKPSDTEHGIEMATVEEWIEDGECTIDGINPYKWGLDN